MRFSRAILPGLLFLGAAGAHAAVINVRVIDFDYTAAPTGTEIIDPTINLGDTIHWIWQSNLHSVTSVAGSLESFNSGLLNNGATFDHTFTNVGVFNYYCTVHGADNGDGTALEMAGRITVVPEPMTMLALGAGAVGLVLRRRKRA